MVFKHRSPQNKNKITIELSTSSKHELTEAETYLLNKGLNFSLPNSKKNIPHFIATIENVMDNNFSKFTEADKTINRHNVCVSLKSVKDEAHQLNPFLPIVPTFAVLFCPSEAICPSETIVL